MRKSSMFSCLTSVLRFSYFPFNAVSDNCLSRNIWSHSRFVYLISLYIVNKRKKKCLKATQSSKTLYSHFMGFFFCQWKKRKCKAFLTVWCYDFVCLYTGNDCIVCISNNTKIYSACWIFIWVLLKSEFVTNWYWQLLFFFHLLNKSGYCGLWERI